MRRALALGVKIAVGTDAAVYPRGRNAGELALPVEMGPGGLRRGVRVRAEGVTLTRRDPAWSAGGATPAVSSVHEEHLRLVQFLSGEP